MKITVEKEKKRKEKDKKHTDNLNPNWTAAFEDEIYERRF